MTIKSISIASMLLRFSQSAIELINENIFQLTVTKLLIREIQIFIRTK